MPARLRQQYVETIRPALQQQFNYQNVHEIPKLDKIVLNMGVGEAVADSKKIDAAVGDMTLIAGQKPVVTRARNS
ncbi:MAG: 50S ribosomal protein L5, partial [Alphaproteobacteria bacterium]|nr:50S ribosomal protein L5 [Alphaproteobacteria bacterium]